MKDAGSLVQSMGNSHQSWISRGAYICHTGLAVSGLMTTRWCVPRIPADRSLVHVHSLNPDVKKLLLWESSGVFRRKIPGSVGAIWNEFSKEWMAFF